MTTTCIDNLLTSSRGGALRHFGDVAAVADQDFGVEATCGERFVTWLFANEAEIRATEWHDKSNPHSVERFEALYDKMPTDALTRDEFLAVTRHLPFSQILGDLEDFAGRRSHDQDADLRAYVSDKLELTAATPCLTVVVRRVAIFSTCQLGCAALALT